MGETEIRALALFFFFSCLDEVQAREAASKAADEFERLLKRDPHLKPMVGVVLSTAKVWSHLKNRFVRGRPNYSSDSGWILPDEVDLGHWKEFQKTAPEDELLAVIWVHILGLHEKEVSDALGLTAGTLRYRVGRGLRKLGNILSASGRPLKVVKLR